MNTHAINKTKFIICSCFLLLNIMTDFPKPSHIASYKFAGGNSWSNCIAKHKSFSYPVLKYLPCGFSYAHRKSGNFAVKQFSLLAVSIKNFLSLLYK